jgi:hypothetical protein
LRKKREKAISLFLTNSEKREKKSSIQTKEMAVIYSELVVRARGFMLDPHVPYSDEKMKEFVDKRTFIDGQQVNMFIEIFPKEYEGADDEKLKYAPLYCTVIGRQNLAMGSDAFMVPDFDHKFEPHIQLHPLWDSLDLEERLNECLGDKFTPLSQVEKSLILDDDLKKRGAKKALKDKGMSPNPIGCEHVKKYYCTSCGEMGYAILLVFEHPFSPIFCAFLPFMVGYSCKCPYVATVFYTAKSFIEEIQKTRRSNPEYALMVVNTLKSRIAKFFKGDPKKIDGLDSYLGLFIKETVTLFQVNTHLRRLFPSEMEKYYPDRAFESEKGDSFEQFTKIIDALVSDNYTLK